MEAVSRYVLALQMALIWGAAVRMLRIPVYLRNEMSAN
jgi:hypothetical protein